ncbi:MAG: ATP-binding protein [Myxococcota bacterium]
MSDLVAPSFGPGNDVRMDWGGLSSEEVARVADLHPLDPERQLARLRGAFALRHSDPARARRLTDEELRHAELRGHQVALGRAWVIQNYVMGEKWNPDEMLAHLQRAFEVLSHLKDDWGVARGGDLLAYIYENMGDYPTVLRYAQAALDASIRAQDRLFEANALSSLAGVLIAADDSEGAQRHLEEALTIAEAEGQDRLVGRLLLRRARLERDLGDMQDSLRTLEVAYARAQAVDNPYSMVEAVGAMAGAHEAQGDLALAQALYERGLASELRGEMRALMAPPLLVGLGRVHLALGRPEQALPPLEEVTVVGRRYHMVPVLSEATKCLADALAQLQRFERAFAVLSEHLELREEKMQGEAQRAVKRLEVKAMLDAAEKDAEIHRLKYVELHAMQTQLLESERLATVGTLTAGLTHEMNTPLGVVRSSLGTQRRAVQRLQDGLPASKGRAVKALESALNTSDAAVERLEQLVNSLRRFTRLDEAEYQSLDLVEEIKTTLEVFRPHCPEGVRIVRDLQPVPTIQGWPSALNQALLTLLTNAVEALGASGVIHVRTRTTEEQEVELTLADDGPGIPEALRTRLFELELSREGPRARFRVGLATVKTVIQRHHGRIEVESEVGAGATFRLTLPVTQ